MLITCPECSNNVSDKAISCPLCGYPIKLLFEQEKAVLAPISKPRKPKKKHKKLPNGFGSIKKLSGNRSNPYAAYPPTKEFNLNGSPMSQPAIGYFPDWYTAFDALREYNHNPYDIKKSELTFADVYEMLYKAKFIDNKKKLSENSKKAYASAFKNCSVLHSLRLVEIRKPEMQAVMDNCKLGYSSLANLKSLFGQIFKYAMENDIVEKDYSKFVQINRENDNESGEPFSSRELDILWNHSEDKIVQMILVMIYTGFRITAFETIEINLEDRYLKGGIKTSNGKNRVVPINSLILDYVENIVGFNANNFRQYQFYPKLQELEIDITESGKKHTPHDCRHTFSWLCDKYKVDEFSKHLLMGHSLGSDVEKSVYGHRTFQELQIEIEKLQRPCC